MYFVCIDTLLKCVSHYDFSVLSSSHQFGIFLVFSISNELILHFTLFEKINLKMSRYICIAVGVANITDKVR